jgi:sulfotransferase
MDNGLHFISGLPRSGSTLLAGILRQNPKMHAGMSSPVGPLFARVLQGMGPRNEFSVLMTIEQRQDMLRGLFDSYYKRIHESQIVFDTNRIWCAKMAAIAELFPQSRVIVCVRELAWIMDSFEAILRRNPLVTTRMFRQQDAATIYTRVGSLASPSGTVGYAWNAVQEAFYGEHSGKLVVIDYEALTREPKRALDFIYETLGLPRFEHDFDNVTYDEGDGVDAQLGVPGLHAVARKVRFSERQTILPMDLFERFSGRNFWRRPRANPRQVAVLLPSTARPRSMPPAGMGPPPAGAGMMRLGGA